MYNITYTDNDVDDDDGEVFFLADRGGFFDKGRIEEKKEGRRIFLQGKMDILRWIVCMLSMCVWVL